MSWLHPDNLSRRLLLADRHRADHCRRLGAPGLEPCRLIPCTTVAIRTAHLASWRFWNQRRWHGSGLVWSLTSDQMGDNAHLGHEAVVMTARGVVDVMDSDLSRS